ncbi:hypothetical protein J2790_001656 [Paenarthrobacter nicotinovorans]|nr:hypothetical protein [Paenarthrobacter nicotinovorans]
MGSAGAALAGLLGALGNLRAGFEQFAADVKAEAEEGS